MNCATATLEQLGGTGKLKAMIGACNFAHTSKVDIADTLCFSFKGSKKANYVEVRIDLSKDVYELKFYKIVKLNATVVFVANMIFVENLKHTFESFTGLRLSL